jgi:hypothetical protein
MTTPTPPASSTLERAAGRARRQTAIESDSNRATAAERGAAGRVSHLNGLKGVSGQLGALEAIRPISERQA